MPHLGISYLVSRIDCSKDDIVVDVVRSFTTQLDGLFLPVGLSLQVQRKPARDKVRVRMCEVGILI